MKSRAYEQKKAVVLWSLKSPSSTPLSFKDTVMTNRARACTEGVHTPKPCPIRVSAEVCHRAAIFRGYPRLSILKNENHTMTTRQNMESLPPHILKLWRVATKGWSNEDLNRVLTEMQNFYLALDGWSNGDRKSRERLARAEKRLRKGLSPRLFRAAQMVVSHFRERGETL